MDLVDMIESIVNGKAIDSGREFFILPEGWGRQLSDLIDAALRQGKIRRKEELEALHSFFYFTSSSVGQRPESLLIQVEEMRQLCHKADSPAVQSFVLGSLGAILSDQGLTKEAFEVARKGGLRWAELQWSINLALFRMHAAPKEADRELRRLLLLARDAGSEQMIGRTLNNLAVVNDKFLSNLSAAIHFQEEAVSIAHRHGDKANELARITHLASMQERGEQIQSAIKNYDRALALETEVGLSSEGLDILRNVSHLIAEQYRDRTKTILSSHIQASNAPLSEQDIRMLMEKAMQGHIMMSSWDPSRGSVSLTPDNSFANRLSVEKQWEALAVYSYQWMEQSFGTGDERGFHWLAVALRNLGYQGAADAALQAAMECSKAFEKDSKSEESR
jgi:tetratricopeptide (TPR) repeat protein